MLIEHIKKIYKTKENAKFLWFFSSLTYTLLAKNGDKLYFDLLLGVLMRAFSFRYEKLLHMKSFIRRQKEIEFSEIASLIENMKSKIRDYTDFLLNPPEIKDPDLELNYRKYFDAIAAEIRYLNNRIDELTPEYNRRKAIYIEAKKEEKIMEKLKEKRYQKYYKESLLEESKMFDEVGTTEFYNKKFKVH